MSAYASVADYLEARVLSVIPNAKVYRPTGQTGLFEFLSNTSVSLPAVFINSEGFLNNSTYENRVYARDTRFAIYFLGRDKNVEDKMFKLSKAIHSAREFSLTSDDEVDDLYTYTAKVTGGRYLGLDAGYDAYQIEIAIN